MQCLIRLLRSLGFAINWEKCISPTRSLTFLGVRIDSTDCSPSIPPEKLSQVQSLVEHYAKSENKRFLKRELQSLLGKLNWVGRVVSVIRPVMRRIIVLMTLLHRANHRTHITADTRCDLSLLNVLCASFNGTCRFNAKQAVPDRAFHIATDASSVAPGAAIVRNNRAMDWLYCDFRH